MLQPAHSGTIYLLPGPYAPSTTSAEGLVDSQMVTQILKSAASTPSDTNWSKQDCLGSSLWDGDQSIGVLLGSGPRDGKKVEVGRETSSAEFRQGGLALYSHTEQALGVGCQEGGGWGRAISSWGNAKEG